MRCFLNNSGEVGCRSVKSMRMPFASIISTVRTMGTTSTSTAREPRIRMWSMPCGVISILSNRISDRCRNREFTRMPPSLSPRITEDREPSAGKSWRSLVPPARLCWLRKREKVKGIQYRFRRRLWGTPTCSRRSWQHTVWTIRHMVVRFMRSAKMNSGNGIITFPHLWMTMTARLLCVSM